MPPASATLVRPGGYDDDFYCVKDDAAPMACVHTLPAPGGCLAAWAPPVAHFNYYDDSSSMSGRSSNSSLRMQTLPPPHYFIAATSAADQRSNELQILNYFEETCDVECSTRIHHPPEMHALALLPSLSIVFFDEDFSGEHFNNSSSSTSCAAGRKPLRVVARSDGARDASKPTTKTTRDRPAAAPQSSGSSLKTTTTTAAGGGGPTAAVVVNTSASAAAAATAAAAARANEASCRKEEEEEQEQEQEGRGGRERNVMHQQARLHDSSNSSSPETFQNGETTKTARVPLLFITSFPDPAARYKRDRCVAWRCTVDVCTASSNDEALLAAAEGGGGGEDEEEDSGWYSGGFPFKAAAAIVEPYKVGDLRSSRPFSYIHRIVVRDCCGNSATDNNNTSNRRTAEGSGGAALVAVVADEGLSVFTPTAASFQVAAVESMKDSLGGTFTHCSGGLLRLFDLRMCANTSSTCSTSRTSSSSRSSSSSNNNTTTTAAAATVLSSNNSSGSSSSGNLFSSENKGPRPATPTSYYDSHYYYNHQHQHHPATTTSTTTSGGGTHTKSAHVFSSSSSSSQASSSLCSSTSLRSSSPLSFFNATTKSSSSTYTPYYYPYYCSSPPRRANNGGVVMTTFTGKGAAQEATGSALNNTAARSAVIERHNPHGSFAAPLDVHYNPNMPYNLVTASTAGSAAYWDLRRLEKPTQVLRDIHSHWVTCVRFNGFHDQLLLSASTDNTVKLHCVEASGESSSRSSSSIGGYDGSAATTFASVRSSSNRDEAADSQEQHESSAGLEPVFSYDGSEDSVAAAAWAADDAWTFAALYADGRVSFHQVPSKVKYRILL